MYCRLMNSRYRATVCAPMLYIDHLKTVTGCPFCKITATEEAIEENDTAFLTYALAPYAKHHLLVVTKRHVVNLLDVTPKETQDIDALIRLGAKIVTRLGNSDYSILLRSGHVEGKSVPHLHYHVIPHVKIGNAETGGDARSILTPEEAAAFLKECRELKSSL